MGPTRGLSGLSTRCSQSSGLPSKPLDCQYASLLGFIWVARLSRSLGLLISYLLLRFLRPRLYRLKGPRKDNPNQADKTYPLLLRGLVMTRMKPSGSLSPLYLRLGRGGAPQYRRGGRGQACSRLGRLGDDHPNPGRLQSPVSQINAFTVIPAEVGIQGRGTWIPV